MLSDRWLVFALLFFARTTIAYQFQSVASSGRFLIDSRLVDFATLGALIGCYMLPGVAVALPGGLLDQRFGAKRTVMLGLVLMTAGSFVMAFGSTPLLFGGRLMSGAGAAVLNVVLARMVASWFAEGELVGVMGAFVASWPLGIALALVSLPMVTVAFGWAAVMVAAALPSLFCLAVFAAVYRDPVRSSSGQSMSLRLNLSGREVLLASVAGLIWGLYNVALVVFVSALPEFFVELGYPFTQAAAIASVFGWVLVFSLPAGGYFGQRVGRASLVMSACFLVIAASAVSLALTSATTLSLALLVVAIGLPAGLIMAVPAKMLAPERRPAGMGVFFTVFYLTLATLPGVAGLVHQHTGNVASPILFGAATISAACVAVLYLAWLRRHEVRSSARAA